MVSWLGLLKRVAVFSFLILGNGHGGQMLHFHRHPTLTFDRNMTTEVLNEGICCFRLCCCQALTNRYGMSGHSSRVVAVPFVHELRRSGPEQFSQSMKC